MDAGWMSGQRRPPDVAWNDATILGTLNPARNELGPSAGLGFGAC
jgi:hypothetical protein